MRTENQSSPTDFLVEAIAVRVAEILSERLAKLVPERSEAPALLDRRGLARALDCSVDSIDKLRAQGMPEIKLVDAPRFQLSAVIEWLRSRA